MLDDVKGMPARTNDRPKERFFIWLLGGLAVVSIVTVVLLYVYKFSGGLSSSSSHWSEFGSYFGGVLGPLISFFTLITVFVTVLLQREMIKLQQDTFVSQINQAKSLASEAQQGRIDSRKSMILSVIDRMVAGNIRDSESLSMARRETIKVLNLTTNFEALTDIRRDLEAISKRIEEVENRKLSLDRVFYDLSMKNYATIEKLQEDYESRMSDVYDKK